MSNSRTIVFVAPQIQQPRVIRRIATIYNSDIPVKVYGFDSGIFSKNLQSITFPITEIIKRDKKDSRLKKILLFVKTLKRIKRENSKDSIFYIFSAEMGIFSWIFRDRQTIYEEADILGAYFKNAFVRKIFKWVDKRTIRRSKMTVFTSEGFIDYTFDAKKNHENVIVIPNKLNNKFFNAERKHNVKRTTFSENNIKFGFVGIIRYPNTIVRFAEVVGKYFPQHEFHFFGDPDVEAYVDNVKKMPNVFLHGPFINPTELPDIYNQIDIVISCYDITNWNVRVAEPNKLYEAIFFETPIVVSNNTFLEKQVNKYNAGYSINADNDDSIIEFIRSIKCADIERFKKDMANVSWQNLVDNTAPFMEKINSIVNK